MPTLTITFTITLVLIKEMTLEDESNTHLALGRGVRGGRGRALAVMALRSGLDPIQEHVVRDGGWEWAGVERGSWVRVCRRLGRSGCGCYLMCLVFIRDCSILPII